MEPKELLPIESLAATSYKKCGCCGRVRDVYYRMSIKDAATGKMIVGTIELCDDCGGNFGDIIGQDVNPEKVVREFTFG